MRKIGKKKLIVGGVAAAVIAAGAGTALAYWSSTGQGTGSATTDSAKKFVVTIDSTNLKDLSPNGPTETIKFHVNNPSSGNQNFTQALASVASTSAGAGCTALDFSVGTPAITYKNLGPNETVDGTFTLQMIDTGKNQDLCQGATVNLQVDAS